MAHYCKLTDEQLQIEYTDVARAYERLCQKKLTLDMSRGKPCPDQLSLSSRMMLCLHEDDYMTESGIDCRNYGCLDGIPEMKQIFADMLELEPSEVIVGSNSSLSMMFDNVAVNMSHGVRDGIPWQRQGHIKFLCPSPGYDRHFSICEYFHIEMIPIEMDERGPDMDTVERLVSSDPLIKGMWCVPVFSNPDGYVYADETVRRIARLRPAAVDFRLYWDDAYGFHHFRGERVRIPNIIRECAQAGNPDMPLVFASFSKISFSGSAVSAMATSKSNVQYILTRLGVQTIGPDKLNQLRHVDFFKNAEGVYAHMEKMAALVRPKFDIVLDALEREITDKGIGHWNNPRGGYFISFYALDGCAKRIISLCRDAGVIMTPAGSTYPYKKDARDNNIRIAPTYPSQAELSEAMEVFCCAVKLASLEKMLGLSTAQ